MTMAMFLVICLVQMFHVVSVAAPDSTELAKACSKIGGPMDEAWRSAILAMYEERFQGMETSRYGDLSSEERAILLARDYTEFTATLDRYTTGLKGVYGERAEQAYAKLRAASESGSLVFGYSPAAELMADQSVLSWSYLAFMILLSADLFSGENSTNMAPIQKAAKNGRRKVFRVKWMACQLSAAFVWLTANLCYGLSATFLCGWGNLQSIVQDFSFNFCPYRWNVGQYLAITLLTGFAASQMCAAIGFLLSALSRNLSGAFALMGGVLFCPYLLACITKSTRLALWIPCLMNGQWLWSNLRLLKAGNVYIPLWLVAGAELALTAGILGYTLRYLIVNREESFYEV